MKDKMLAPHPPTANPHRGFSPMGMENIAAVANFGTAETNKVSLELQDMKVMYRGAIHAFVKIHDTRTS